MIEYAAWPNPIHDERPNSTLWSRANLSEAIPGVATPLTWTFWAEGTAYANRETWGRLGLLSREEALIPQGVVPADDFMSVFWGRPVVNVDWVRALFGRMPGADPDKVELQFLGSVREGVPSETSKRRWPAIAWRAPRELTRLEAKAQAARAETDWWWRAQTVPGRFGTADSAGRGIADALDRFQRIQVVHGLCLLVGQLAYDQTARLCASAERDDLVFDLTASVGGTEESAMVDDLWEVERGERTLEAFVADHGYHGPDEGALHSYSWRDDPSPLEELIGRYRAQGTPREANASRRRAQACHELLGRLSPLRRQVARGVLRMAETAIPRREVTKAANLQALDGARCAARALGALLYADGRLEDPEDVFYLTLAEATGPADLLPLAEIPVRKATRKEYLDIEIPTGFVGRPEPVAREPVALPTSSELMGVGAGAGHAEGRARVVGGVDELHTLEPGDILVCGATDPAWVPFFEIAAGAVVEIGGPMSHAAIVAREMGLPCVVGLDGATARIRDGDHVVVDGASGAVTVRPSQETGS